MPSSSQKIINLNWISNNLAACVVISSKISAKFSDQSVSYLQNRNAVKIIKKERETILNMT